MTSLKFSRGTSETPCKVFHVAVVGVSGGESSSFVQSQEVRERSSNDIYRSHDLISPDDGPGKSCLCNRFVRPAEDDYRPSEYGSLLSAADYATTPINNDHFLYWGETHRTSDDGYECVFSLIEQTEIIDDSNFQPFRSGKGDRDYVRRATNSKIQSSGKIQYFGKSQLGMENEYPLIPMPDGRFNVDGFICTFDVSPTSKRPLSRQIETVFQLLSQIVRQKKPVVLAATKADQGNVAYLNEATKLLHRKELKGCVQLVETSALRHVNVDAAFMLLAQLIERTSGHTQLIRYRCVPYTDAASMRKERMETASKAFESLIRCQVKDRKVTWHEASRKLENDQDFKFYCELFGTESAKKVFNTYMRQLRDREAKSRLSIYLSRLERIFNELLPSVALVNSGWSACLDYLQSLPVFDSYFADLFSGEGATSGPINFLDDDSFYDSGDTRVPSRILYTADAERCFIAYAESMKREEKRLRLCDQFVSLLDATPYALPGRSFRDVCVFLATEPAYTDELNDLNVAEKQNLYEAHQKKIIEIAKESFMELLMENISLFQPKQDVKQLQRRKKEHEFSKDRPLRLEKQEEVISGIENMLRADRRFRAMDLLASSREAILVKMLLYFRSPFPEGCGLKSGCFDTSVRRLLARLVKLPEILPAFAQYSILDEENYTLKIVLLGKDDLAKNLENRLRSMCGEDELRLDGSLYSIDFRIISGDLSLPQNAFQTSSYLPHGCFCIYDSNESFQYVRDSMEESLRRALIHEECSVENLYETNAGITPCSGLPTVIVFDPQENLKETKVRELRECGRDLVAKLQCAFLEVTRVIKPPLVESTTATSSVAHKFEVVMSYFKTLVRDIRTRSNIAKSITDGHASADLFDCDMRIRVCLMCGDHPGGFAHHILSPLMSHTICYRNTLTPQSCLVDSYVSEDTKIRTDIDCRSYHEVLRMLNPYNVDEDPSRKSVDGYVFVFAVKRRASYRNLRNVMDMLTTHNAFRPFMVIGVVEHKTGPTREESQLLNETEELCRQRNVTFLVTNTSDGMSISTYTTLMQNCWEFKVSAYDRASTATLNSTIPSLSDDEAALLSSRSLERDKPAFSFNRPSLSSFGGAGSLDSPTFRTFGFDRKRSVRARADTDTSDELIAPISRLATEEAEPLRITRSTEDILASNGRDSPLSIAVAAGSDRHFISDDLGPLPGQLRSQRNSVPSEQCIMQSSEKFQLESNPAERPCSATGSMLPKQVHISPRNTFTRSTSELNVTSPLMEESKRVLRPFLRSIAAWQGKSTDQDTDKDKSSGARSVGKLNTAGKYASFIEQLNANIARGSQQSPTAPLALPELVEDHEHDPETWDESQLALKSPASDRQFLLGLRKRNKELRPPDRNCFRRVIVPTLPPGPAHHLSLSHEDLEHAFPARASLPEIFDKSAVFLVAASPLDDNVFFSSSVEEPSSSGARAAETNGVKPSKPLKLKRDKEKSIKKAKEKEKKKKAVPTFEDFAQSLDKPIPLFIEMCITFIETRGIDTEGIYRVSGSRVHADELLRKFLSNPSSVDLASMDIPIYNVTTALKTFLTDQTPPVIPQSFVDELHDLNFTRDKTDRIQLIKSALAHLSATHFQLLKYIFAHLRRVSENSKKNKMDSNNLTLCLWPTLCPIELPNDMARFEGIRVEVSEILSIMITEYDKIFEPNYSPMGNKSSVQIGALAQEAAEAARQRGTRHASGHNASSSSSQSSPPQPLPGSLPLTSSDVGSPGGLVKGPLLTGLKSVQV